jgi:Flp pilus assembly pilin Flp
MLPWHNIRSTMCVISRPILRPRLLRDTRGAVMTEYIVLLGTVSLTVSVAIAALGAPLVRSFENTRDVLLLPFP